jgi:hypothetical protein
VTLVGSPAFQRWICASAALWGVVKVHPGRFVLYEIAGALAWSAVWMGLGYVFTDLIEQVAAEASRLGGMSVLVLLGCLAGYLAIKFVQRRRFLRALRMARISPEELKQMLDEGKETLVVDLRTSVPASIRDGGGVANIRLLVETLDAEGKVIGQAQG